MIYAAWVLILMAIVMLAVALWSKRLSYQDKATLAFSAAGVSFLGAALSMASLLQ